KTQDIGKIFSYVHTSTVSNYYREITREAGVKSRFHDLRHTAATQMLTAGIPLEVVQKILGHTELRTTQIYAKVVQDRLKIEMEKLKY
ncbi:MAG: tyrosine-type recombinase/integrase, partial [Desulfotignum sp.]|nr:tyrosine-type recombinase/integrase [Desulfotignum sp.]